MARKGKDERPNDPNQLPGWMKTEHHFQSVLPRAFTEEK